MVWCVGLCIVAPSIHLSSCKFSHHHELTEEIVLFSFLLFFNLWSSWNFILSSRTRNMERHKVGCVLQMVVLSILPHAEFGPNGHREGTPHFTFWVDDRVNRNKSQRSLNVCYYLTSTASHSISWLKCWNVQISLIGSPSMIFHVCCWVIIQIVQIFY